MRLIERLERYFEFAALGTTWKTELLAGATTFMTMAYIVFVNPSILHEAGMPTAGVTAATCLAAAVGSVLMGAFACYPIALVPGMCLNALFSSERDGHRLACRARRRLSFTESRFCCL